MCSGVEEHVCHSFVTTSSEKATLLMQPSVGAHLVSWFLSNRDTNRTNERLAALWLGGQLHLFIKEEFLYGLCQELNLCHSEEMSGKFTKRVFNMESEQTLTLCTVDPLWHWTEIASGRCCSVVESYWCFLLAACQILLIAFNILQATTGQQFGPVLRGLF